MILISPIATYFAGFHGREENLHCREQNRF